MLGQSADAAIAIERDAQQLWLCADDRQVVVRLVWMVAVEGREELQHGGGEPVGCLLDRSGEVGGSLVVGGDRRTKQHRAGMACTIARAPSGVPRAACAE